MARALILSVALLSLTCAARTEGQIWPLQKRGTPQPAVPVDPQGELVAVTGSDTVYFTRRSITLDPASATLLAAQARWLIANPTVTARLEGHADQQDTRSYALAIAGKRAEAVRDYLVLQGVSPDRLKVVSWGKERPGTVQLGSMIVRVGARVVIVVSDSGGPPPLAGR